MENTQTGDVKMPITYEDLKQSLVDSGRPYDFDMIDRAYALAEKAHGGQRRRSRISAIRCRWRPFWWNWVWTARASPPP